MRKFTISETLKLLDTMIGSTEPVADSAIDKIISDNVDVLIEVTNWCLDGLYDTARHRNSWYSSQKVIGEKAYSSILEYQRMLSDWKDEL